MRRPPLRVWVWTAVTVALAVAAGLLWRGSDAAATTSTTAPATRVPAGTPADRLTESWTATGHPVPRHVVQRGRVLVGNGQGVTALDPLTGREVWHYTRTNRPLCDLTATDGLVVAVYRTGDRCDQVVALRADTGVRAWTRNVNFLPGVRLSATTSIVLASTPTGLVTIDPAGDNIRWRYRPDRGCRIDGALPGNTGIAVLERCAGATSPRLRLLDGFAGTVRWTHNVAVPAGTPVHLALADWLVAVVAGDELRLFARGDGAPVGPLPLPAGDGDATGGVTGDLAVDGQVLLQARGTLYALDAKSGALRWQAPAIGVPAVVGNGKPLDGDLTVLVPDGEGFTRLDAVTGAVTGHSVPATTPPAGGIAEVVGPAVVYRLPDRVLGYR